VLVCAVRNLLLMNKIYFLLVLSFISLYSMAQVKSTYIYNTAMPYGTLDLRTKISTSEYYYLQIDKTFSFRESSPGVRTNTYLDMTSFDSSPYGQGNMRKKIGTADKFVMNYRLLPPLNYSATYPDGYPMMVLLHGAVERGNCYYNNCYHSNWSYDPNVNSPAAPTTNTHKLLNNDHNLSQGAKSHLDARNKAAGKLPNDPTVTGRMFPGFVLVPQMFNVWDSLNVQDVARLVQLIAQKYNIDENRIYVHGLSIGGYAVYESLKRAHWLFAAAQPMSAVKDASIRKYKQESKIVSIPLWVYQGGTDTAPSVSYTNKLVNDLKNAGAVVRYSVYDGVGHTCWYKAFAEPEFYSWALKQSKTNISVSKGITVISGTYYPKLMLNEGFFAYQWEKDGVIISGATTNTYIAKLPGKYRARFSRVANPTSTQWNKWSPIVTITKSTSGREDVAMVEMQEGLDDSERLQVYANPTHPKDLTISFDAIDSVTPVDVQFIDMTGKVYYQKIHGVDELRDGRTLDFTESVKDGLYVLLLNQGNKMYYKKVAIIN
jgi:hypothetical protein